MGLFCLSDVGTLISCSHDSLGGSGGGEASAGLGAASYHIEDALVDVSAASPPRADASFACLLHYSGLMISTEDVFHQTFIITLCFCDGRHGNGQAKFKCGVTNMMWSV